MKKEDRNNETLGILSTRLRETREEKGLTQAQLANLVGLTTEKINYSELNIKGRKLQIEDLVKIADILNVSIDYLVGRKQNKTDTISNGLGDTTNQIIAEWENDTLGIWDMLVQEFNYSFILTDLKVYIFISYVIKNILTDTLESIESKVKRKVNISHIETQKIDFIKEYIEYFKKQKTTYYSYVEKLAQNHERTFNDAKLECDKVLNYNKDKNSPINFNKIMALSLVFDLFKTHLSIQLKERIDKTIMENMINNISKDNQYFKNIKKYFKEVI